MPLHSGHEQEKAELLLIVNRLREITNLCNDAAEEWFGNIHEVQGASGIKAHVPAVEAHFTLQHSWLQRYPRLYKIIYVWDVQKRELQSTLRKRGRNSKRNLKMLPSRRAPAAE